MKKFVALIFRKLLAVVNDDTAFPLIAALTQLPEEPGVPYIPTAQPKKAKVQRREELTNTSKVPVIRPQNVAARDMSEIMEVPFLALSKDRREPIIYEKHNGPNMIKVRVSRHTGHFLASIYDWDIILIVAGKMQEILNKGSDIPPRTMTFPRHEIFKSIKKMNVTKQQKDLEESLSRLQLTGIETTISNKDGKYRAGFGFLDSWGYTERKDIREIHITLSQWLYDIICTKGSLLKVDPEYFGITSGLKRFLYRTARKHIGGHSETFEFSIEKLYEKSGSEQELRKFKSDLKIAVLKNDIPGYSLKWITRDKKTIVSFKNRKKSLLLDGLDDVVKKKKLLQ
jgi:plasmid replication initiation protein